MFLFSWLRRMTTPTQPIRRAASRPRFRPEIEALEDRSVPAVLNVTTALDVVDPNDGVLSLREAIQQADPATPGGDTIVFDNSLNGQAIILNGSELLIDKNLNIQGPGADLLAISGNQLSRVFIVTAQVSLADLTICDGKFMGDPFNLNTGGGGILNAGTLTVCGCTLSNNSSEKGGGIYNSSRLTMSGCTLSGNSATNSGGGFFNQGIATVNDCTLSGNSAQWGGGIQNNSTLTVSGCTLSGNSAAASGGGIVSGGGLTVTGCTLSGNSAAKGGGIYSYGTLTVSSTTLSNNFASVAGGGIYAADNVTIQASVLTGNSADVGGGIYYAGVPKASYLSKATLTIKDSTIANNTATSKGGGVYNNGAATLRNTTVSGNSAEAQGGGIFNDAKGTLTLYASSAVTGNVAPDGPDIYNLGRVIKKKG